MVRSGIVIFIPILVQAKLAIAGHVKVGLGSAVVVACRSLHVGLGYVAKAFVFDRAHVGLGNITELHCLPSTHLTVRLGSVDRVVYHTADELAVLAADATGMPLVAGAATQTSTTASTTTTMTTTGIVTAAPRPGPGQGRRHAGPYAATPLLHAAAISSQQEQEAPPYTPEPPAGMHASVTPPVDLPPSYEDFSREKYTLA